MRKRTTRLTAWLSGRALADRAGISTAYLSQIETGKKPGSFDAIAKLARAFEVDIEDLER